MNPFFSRSLNFLVCIFLSACAPVSYLKDHRPADLIFQKKVYGGVTALVGNELQAPGFSLYADGSVIYYQYIGGQRKLVFSRLSESDFSTMYDWIQKTLSLATTDIPKQPGAPVTEFFFNSKIITVEGLGFVKGYPILDTLQEFSKTIDQLTFKKSKKYISEKIVLYVKRTQGGDPKSWPEWKIKDINLVSVYKKDIGFYEPNSEENSTPIEDTLAEEVQKKIEQTSIYQKFSFNGQIYAVGYKPVLP